MIITLADYKAYAGINSPNNDAKLTPLVAFVNAYIQNYCTVNFTQTVLTAQLFSSSSDGMSISLPMKHTPIISVEEIRTNSGADIVNPSLYQLDAELGLIEVTTSSKFPTATLSIEVDYTYGYSTIPEDLVLVAYELVTYYFKREFTESRNMGSESADYGKPEHVPSYIKMALNMYRFI